MKKVLIIAGVDPSGNAGLLRDVETVKAFNLHASAVVTALTAQNNKSFISAGVVDPLAFNNQLKSVLPLSQYNAIKLGMMGNEKLLSNFCKVYSAQKRKPFLVVDPVMMSSSGGELLTKKGRKFLFDKIIPLATVWTPNLDEASFFYKQKLVTVNDMKQAVQLFFSITHTPCLIKGGHLGTKKLVDVLIDQTGKISTFEHKKIKGSFRGTGCQLASAIAALLAKGFVLNKAVAEAIEYQQKVFHTSTE